ncbi:MAG: toxin-antitoxin system HicB family antitoxin [Sulfitobacter sp.]|uniref:toxin-antitoxin system HicB family antitoxin n=1 Tax=unclassified Sulfitobacter TaxID=196795 RepID=UPI002943EC1B|nr:toxin-antitoxin system HicB family antitoxin [Sulfitobacter sp. LC.270.F.C4]WOI13568.1 toxin-antitoxin system HicB family antitoxin [Sulfitobacter sp. LC.270.F.C4]
MTEDASKRITLRLPPDLHASLTEIAQREGRSLNNQIVWLLRSASDPDRLSDEQLLMKLQWMLTEITKEAARIAERIKP